MIVGLWGYVILFLLKQTLIKSNWLKRTPNTSWHHFVAIVRAYSHQAKVGVKAKRSMNKQQTSSLSFGLNTQLKDFFLCSNKNVKYIHRHIYTLKYPFYFLLQSGFFFFFHLLVDFIIHNLFPVFQK